MITSEKSKCRRAACSKIQAILARETNIAYMIYEHFRATGAYDTVQALSDLFAVGLQNDDIQDFDVRWSPALLSASDMPSDVIFEGLYMSK